MVVQGLFRPFGASEGWTGYWVGCEVAGVGFPCFWVGDFREVMALCIGFFVVDFSRAPTGRPKVAQGRASAPPWVDDFNSFQPCRGVIRMVGGLFGSVCLVIISPLQGLVFVGTPDPGQSVSAALGWWFAIHFSPVGA